MGVADPAFPSSEAFDMIDSALNASEEDRKEAIKRGGAIFAFTLKNAEGKQESWYLDLKKEGKVGKGASPPGEKATVTLVLTDADFGKLVKGTAKAQTLFMGGKLKIKGDMMKATRLEPILGQARQQGAKL
ncbi:putative fatty acid-binding protein [Microthyrium microscopicum]|uniref:Putative fatty acid-binding protein n=1 Tax=Microthyrium microscopicum TaxID=703497 RepID=A0A6A6UBC2_9PEZI|nr:putative fatty acid-binding protein [Microthyrium microscopicum]